MPTPHPGESRDDWMGRCVPFVLDEGTAKDQDQAVAICMNMFEGKAMKRGYSLLKIKSLDEDQRIIHGIATTPQTDLVDDIVEPRGAAFTLPIPFLYQHDARQPIGHVQKARVTDEGIEVEVKLVKINEPGTLKDRLDNAWQSIKHGLVRGLSIGFKDIESEPIKGTFGSRIKKWNWLELSAVTIAANAEASITAIKQIDSELRAATGNAQSVVQDPPGDSGSKTNPAGASAPRKSRTVKAEEAKPMAKKTIGEQIQAFEATRQAKSARMSELMDDAAEKNETLDEAAKEEYDNLEADVKSVDEHLVRLRKMEAANKAAAIPVQGSSVELATQSRGAVSVQMRPNRPPGIGFARIVLAKMAAFKNSRDPMLCAQELWPSDPDIADYFKTAVAGGTTILSGYASQLVVSQNMPSEFVEYLRPKSLVTSIPGFRRVPFNITVPRQTAGASASWVGEAKAKPLTRPTFDSITLTHKKMAAISVFSEELARFSNPSVETLVRDDIAEAISQSIDSWFFDPSQAGTANVSPASITNNVDTDVAQGTAIGDLDEDLREAFANFQAAEVDLAGVVICMQPQQATAIGMMKNALGQVAFPTISGTGGTLYGLPVYTSTSVGTGRIVLFKPSECLMADDGGVNVAVSNQASLQMDDDPTAGAQTLVSLFQTDRVAVRVERYLDFKMRRADAVYYISSSDFGAYTTA